MKPEMYIPRTIGRASFADNPSPQARIYRNGVLMLNVAAAKRILGTVDTTANFVLYFYRDLGQIGIRAARVGDPAGAVVTGRPKARHGALQLHVSGFFRQFGVDPERAAGLFTVGIDERNALAVIPLPKGARPARIDVMVDQAGRAA